MEEKLVKDEEEIKKEITALFEYHSTRVKEQTTDQEYYDDVFPTSIVSPYHVVRTGFGGRIVDSIVEHVESANPQAFREPRKKAEAELKSTLKVSRLLNHWLELLIPEIDESIKNAVQRGEGVFQIEYNDKYNEQIPDSLPVIITSLDPLSVFTDPYDSLIPDRVAKKYEMNANYVKSLYPELAPFSDKRTLTYQAYWNKDWKYFSIDDKSVNDGVKENIYGFVPFVHFYASFGKKSHEGKPESLAVGILRKKRGRLKEECETESRIDSIIALYANPLRLIAQTAVDAAEADKKELEDAYLGPGATLVVPYGWTQIIYTPDVPAAQLFQHQYQIRQALLMDNPPIMSGIGGESGRQDDITAEHAQKKSVRLVHNLCEALAQVLSMGLRILDTIPGALPITARATVIKNGEPITEEYKVTKEDIGGYYGCTVKLNPEEAIEHDRKVMLGRTLVNEGRISWELFLIDYMGMTEDEADKTISDAIAEQAILNDPTMSQIRVMEAIEQAGMTRYLEKIQQTQQAPPPQIRPSEAKNPVARETIRQALGEKGVARTPPEGNR